MIIPSEAALIAAIWLSGFFFGVLVEKYLAWKADCLKEDKRAELERTKIKDGAK